MALIPSEDGTELTVLLLNVEHAHHVSDGTTLAQHKPLLVARAGNCTGQCPKRDSDIAEYLFADQTTAVALDSLEAAVDGGGAWELVGSDLTLRKGSTSDPDLPSLVLRKNVRGMVNGEPRIIPTTSAEREDYTWLADLDQLCPTCELNPAVLGSQPPAGIVAARLRLRSGNVFTYSIARIGTDVTPVHFKRLDGQGSASPYTQAVATWMAAEIAISGDSVEIVEAQFDGGAGRSMLLEPNEEGQVEIAVLNLPPFVPPATSPRTATPEVGKHFEHYYELADTPPAAATRLVPRAGAAPGAQSYPAVNWELIHPQTTLWSDLLNAIRLNVGRGAYDITLCPPAGGGGG